MATRITLVALTAVTLLLPHAGCSSFSWSKPKGTIGASSPAGGAAAAPSMASKVGSSIKSGTGAVVAFVTPKPIKSSSHEEPSKPLKRDCELYITMAQLQERAGKYDKAAAEYQKALEMNPKSLQALVGFAHLKDRHGDLQGATELYQKAIKLYPKEASAYNDLGLCFQRRAMLPEAVGMLQKAVTLQPDRPLYRNNLATVLVQMDRTNDALTHMVAAHGSAVGHYNLAILLTQRGRPQDAIEHFRQALVHDPSLREAQEGIARLMPAQPVAQQVAGVMTEARPTASHIAPNGSSAPQGAQYYQAQLPPAAGASGAANYGAAAAPGANGAPVYPQVQSLPSVSSAAR